ncbi:hypothetical protein ACVME8_006988 [Bradyrhizobium diazoefficiens]
MIARYGSFAEPGVGATDLLLDRIECGDARENGFGDG